MSTARPGHYCRASCRDRCAVDPRWQRQRLPEGEQEKASQAEGGQRGRLGSVTDVLRLPQTSGPPEGVLKWVAGPHPGVSDSAGLGSGPRICISNPFPGDAAGQGFVPRSAERAERTEAWPVGRDLATKRTSLGGKARPVAFLHQGVGLGWGRR